MVEPQTSDLGIIKGHLTGKNLTKLLLKKKTNKWRVAKGCSISWRTLRMWERGDQKPSDLLTLRVAKYLGLISPEAHEIESIKKQQKELSDRIERLAN